MAGDCPQVRQKGDREDPANYRGITLLSVVGKVLCKISDSKESLQKLIDVVYSYCSKWRLRANVSKCI